MNNIVNERINKILEMSLKISLSSHALKPFVRFSTNLGESAFLQRKYWDFDYLLQKKLLKTLKLLATPADLHRLYISHFSNNLHSLARNQEKILLAFQNQHSEYKFTFTPRINYISDQLRSGDKFLYIGCGAGKECLHFAKKGLEVTGIDTSLPLVEVANKWTKHLDLPFQALEMDVLNLDFPNQTFDAVLLEFYGSWASEELKNQINMNLARILKPNGKGFIVAQRKKYASYWFKLSSHFSQKLTTWLKPQSALDFFFDETDAFDERLHYGLYSQSHTESTLQAELEKCFKVSTCKYEDYDPRYVLAEVTPKSSKIESTKIDSNKTNQFPNSRYLLEQKTPETTEMEKIDTVILQIQKLVDMFAEHKNSLEELFKNYLKKNPLKAIKFDLRKFFENLDILNLENK